MDILGLQRKILINTKIKKLWQQQNLQQFM